MSFEIFYRSTAMVTEDVDFKDRIIDVVAMPWEVEAEITWRSQTWKEIFERGSFNEQMEQKVRIPTNREHNRGDTVGRIVNMADDSQRFLASVKIAKTDRGDETLQLASENMLGASVGYYLKRMSDVLIDRRSMTRRVRRAFMDHLALTESPAFRGAETIAVHDDLTQHPMAGMQPLVTPAIDEWLADPIQGWLAGRRDK